mmetsp:Transcript_38778/g.98436  ORF Transcript_38778/g.98436 Transcript_38778/m.98436 type:complete len:84 (+) Transcript_38778:1307-1558(+)
MRVSPRAIGPSKATSCSLYALHRSDISIHHLNLHSLCLNVDHLEMIAWFSRWLGCRSRHRRDMSTVFLLQDLVAKPCQELLRC